MSHAENILIQFSCLAFLTTDVLTTFNSQKKSKKKAKKQESESGSHYSDEEYGGVEDYADGDNFDDRSYSDEESGSY